MKILDDANRLMHTGLLKIKKHSPEILLVSGIVGTVATTIIACKKTLKINDILEEKNETVKAIHEALDKKDDKIYNQDDANKDLTIVYAQTGMKLFELYAPAIGLGVLSIGAIVSGHNILRKRNIAIAAAYAIVDRSFKNYRSNVVERFGQDVDQELRFNVKTKQIKEKDQNGKTVKKEVKEINIDEWHKDFSDYARFFDASCQGHTKDPEYNLMYLKQQQAYCNEILKSRGHLFLNEVYDILDIPRTKAGQVVGWLYDKNGNNPNGDNYVDFGIYDKNYEPSRRFVNGCEYNILLDFNVDGVIYDKI
jgi:hypothetical protein